MEKYIKGISFSLIMTILLLFFIGWTKTNVLIAILANIAINGFIICLIEALGDPND